MTDNYGPLIRHALTGLMAIAFVLGYHVLPASASGSRGDVLSPKKVQSFVELKADALAKRRLNYVGSTQKWHLFMRVKTSVSRGRPFSHLFVYKVAVSAVTVKNGWQITFSKRTIYAANCPLARAVKGKTVEVTIPSGPKVRSHCGT